MKHIEGESRDQIVLFNETLEDLLGEEDPVRFIDIFVDKLNMKGVGFKVKEASTGRSSYKSEILLKIYIYGYLNKIRTSRKLERECRRNTELMWLTGRLAPDFKTIEYQVDKFKYDPGQDVYYCPEGNPLVRNGKKVEKVNGGKEIVRYKCGLCSQCEVRNKCTESVEGRSIKVPVRKEEIENFKRKIRSEAGKKIIEKRKEICEHPFGSIKRNMGYSYFLMKGKDGVLTESSLAGFIHNLIKVLNILGIKRLMTLV